jgi:hypothetical protein
MAWKRNNVGTMLLSPRPRASAESTVRVKRSPIGMSNRNEARVSEILAAVKPLGPEYYRLEGGNRWV